MNEWRAWRTPFIDDFKAMPFSDVATISNGSIDPAPAYHTGARLRDLSDETIDRLIRYGVPAGGLPPFVFVEVRHAGGAIKRVDRQAAAYSHRDAELLLEAIGITPTLEAYQHTSAYAERFKRNLQAHLTGSVYVNFLDVPEARERSRDAYSPETYRRLQMVKAKYDPMNRFNHSFDVTPIA